MSTYMLTCYLFVQPMDLPDLHRVCVLSNHWYVRVERARVCVRALLTRLSAWI